MNVKTDRRVRKTRAQLRSGLAHLMETKSIKEITVKELVDEVDINRSTFYLHYTDIYQMLDSIEAELVEEITEALEELPPNLMTTEKTPFITRMFSILEENKDICIALLGPNGDNTFVTKIEQLIAESSIKAVYDKIPQDLVDINYVYAFCITGCAGMVKAWLNDSDSISPEHMANLTHQLVADTARNYLQRNVN